MDPGGADYAGSSSQLMGEIVNRVRGKAAQNVIYATLDPAYNNVTLRLTLTTGSVLLSPGSIPDPVADPPAPGTGTTIYIDLKSLGLTPEAWGRLTFASPGWRFRAFPALGVAGMTPTAATSLTAGAAGAIQVEVGAITFRGPVPVPVQAQVTAQYFNIPAIVTPYFMFAVVVENVPGSEADLADALAVSLSASGIVNTVPGPPAARNQFALQFAGRGTDVAAGPSTLLTVGFVYGTDEYGYGALTSVSRALEFQVDAGDGAADWTITPDRNAESPRWRLRPPDGHLIGGAQSVVSIRFSNVVTAYQPGPTAMLIAYSGVPGYRDGAFTQVLEKVPHAVIGVLDVTPNPARFHHGAAHVTVSWQAADAKHLELTQNYQSGNVTGKATVPATLDAERTTFTLRATGRPGSVDNSDQAAVQAIALPVIRSFTGLPTEIYYSEESQQVQLAWSVDSNEDVTLSSTAGAFDGQSFRPTGQASVTVTETQLVTLAPNTAADQRTLNSKLVISAFRTTWSPALLGFAPASAAAWPGGSFVVAAGAAPGLSVFDMIWYTLVGTVPLGHAASALAFSADGGTLAVAGPDRTVSVLTVRPEPTGRPAFEAAGVVSLDQPPQSLVASPTGTRVYVTTDPGGGRRGQLVPLLRAPGEHGGYRAGTPIAVGVAPRGLTLDTAGSRLFVANSADDTVTTVALDHAGVPTGASTIADVRGAPEGVAASPDGKRLLAACPKAGTVIVIDPDRPGTGQRKVLQVGGAARHIAMMAGGAYAAAVKDDGSVALIDCTGTPDAARVVDPAAVTPGDLALGISVTPSGLQLLIGANFGLSIMTMVTHEASAVQPSIPNRPTSAAVSPDGGSVLAWHDARIPASSPCPGVFAYQAGSGVVTPVLPEARVTGLVTSPDPYVRQALAIVADDPALRVIATDTLEVTTCPLDLATGTVPVALAIAGDGQSAFVVTRDAGHRLALRVLRVSGATWRAGSALALYQATADGRLLLCAAPDGGTLFLADAAAAQLRVLRRVGQSYALSPTVIAVGANAIDLTVLPDGSTAYVLTSGAPASITVIDVATLTARTATAPGPYGLGGLRPAVDGRWLYATEPDTRTLRVLHPRSLQLLQSFLLDAPQNAWVAGAAGLAVFPDGSGIVTANTESQNLSLVKQVQLGTGPKPPGSSPGPARHGER